MSGLSSMFGHWSKLIAQELRSRIETGRSGYGPVHSLGFDVADRLSRFSTRGKLIRGSLVCLGASLSDGSAPRGAIVAGAAIELFQSALLVHDDIMDRDARRRGEDSLYRQYELKAEAEGIGDALHVGESLGICAGDIAFFLAFELIAGLDLPDQIRSRITSLCARELQCVGVAQMADVYRGAQPISSMRSATEELESTLRVYLYKTGRYTFSLPLMIGAIISNAPEERIGRVEKLGEVFGVLFQIKDDEIGLFGSEEETGKPVGSDIREGKKTLYYAELLSGIGEVERGRFAAVFGNPGATEAEISWVRELTETSGARRRVADRVASYAADSKEMIEGLEGVDEASRRLLTELHDYNMDRTR